MLLVLGVHGAGFWRRPCAHDGQSTGPAFLRLSLHWQKSDNGSYFIHIQICNKMPNSVRSCPNKPPFVLVAFLNLEIVQLSHCLALAACYPLLLSAHYGRVLLCQQPLSGTLSPRTDNHGLPWKQRPGLESVVSLWACMPCSFQPCCGAGFEQAGRQLWLLRNSRAGSSREGEICGAASYPPIPDTSWLRNSHPPWFLEVPRVLSCSFHDGRE